LRIIRIFRAGFWHLRENAAGRSAEWNTHNSGRPAKGSPLLCDRLVYASWTWPKILKTQTGPVGDKGDPEIWTGANRTAMEISVSHERETFCQAVCSSGPKYYFYFELGTLFYDVRVLRCVPDLNFGQCDIILTCLRENAACSQFLHSGKSYSDVRFSWLGHSRGVWFDAL
jgi:hypothetical protein